MINTQRLEIKRNRKVNTHNYKENIIKILNNIYRKKERKKFKI